LLLTGIHEVREGIRGPIIVIIFPITTALNVLNDILLIKGVAMSSDGGERRKNERRVFSDNIEFSLCPPAPHRILVGTCVNISEYGMCIFTFEQLSEGETIEVRDALPVPHKRATVRWVRAYPGNFYKVGLAFVD
jgi:hypothetical protein